MLCSHTVCLFFLSLLFALSPSSFLGFVPRFVPPPPPPLPTLSLLSLLNRTRKTLSPSRFSSSHHNTKDFRSEAKFGVVRISLVLFLSSLVSSLLPPLSPSASSLLFSLIPTPSRTASKRKSPHPPRPKRRRSRKRPGPCRPRRRCLPRRWRRRRSRS